MRFPGIFLIGWHRTGHTSVEAVEAAHGRIPMVVVTGGSEGIGLAVAKRFAKAGHRVAIVARREQELVRAAAEIEQLTGQRPLTIAQDVSEEDAGLRIDGALANAGAYMDILINNAAMGLAGRFMDEDIRNIDQLVAVNVMAVTRLTRHALTGMVGRGRGGIVNVASLAGLIPGPYQAAYYASKAYVISLTQSLAEEERGKGVRIVAAAPGPVNTDFHAEMGAEAALYRILPLSMSPEAVAASIYRGYWLGQRLIVPGLFNRLLATIVGIFPYRLIAPVMSWLLWPGEPSPELQDANDAKQTSAKRHVEGKLDGRNLHN